MGKKTSFVVYLLNLSTSTDFQAVYHYLLNWIVNKNWRLKTINISKYIGLKKWSFTSSFLNIPEDTKPAESVEVRYTTLSGRLVLSPYTESPRERSQATGSVMVFTGCRLSQAKLQEWLQDCAPPVNIGLIVIPTIACFVRLDTICIME